MRKIRELVMAHFGEILFAPVVYEAGARVPAVTANDGVVRQSAAAWLREIPDLAETYARAVRVKSRQGVHALVPPVSGIVITRRLGPAVILEYLGATRCQLLTYKVEQVRGTKS